MRSRTVRLRASAGGLALVLLSFPMAVRAAEPRDFQDYRALVVSGGSSLGVYEAGLLHAFTYARALSQERRPPAAAELPLRPVVVGGTSAGALNGFLTALALCRRPEPAPGQSWFRLWLEIDWNDLLAGAPERRVEVDARFKGAATRERLWKLLDQVKASWVPSDEWVDCNVRLGAAVTHLTPRREKLADSSIKVTRSTERFVVSLQGTRGHPPAIEVVRHVGESRRLQPLLARAPGEADVDERRVEELFPLLLASSGIPLVFDPILLRVSYTSAQAVETQAFVDGGVLDNVPLSTVVDLLGPDAPAEGSHILYVDAGNVAWEPAERHARLPGGLKGYLDLLGEHVTGARQAELVRALDRADWIGRSLLLPRRHHLITGEMLGAFGAFFDESFRRFDFVAGVADAVAALERLPSLHAELRETGGLAALDGAIAELPCFRRAWAVEGQGPGAAEELEGALASPECVALRDAPGEGDGKLRRDEWRLLRVLLSRDPAEERLSHAFFSSLDRADPRASGAPAYEWVTLRRGSAVAGPGDGERTVRDQLQRLVAGVARNNDNGSAIYRSVLVSAGAELADAALLPRRPRWMVSFGLHKGGLELEGAWGLGALQLVANLQVGSGAFEEFQGRGAVSDERASIGVRTDVPLWLLGWRPSFLEYRPGLYLCGQTLFVRGHHQVYRLGVTGRLDVDVLKRLYFGGAVTRFDHARGFATWDWAVDAGVRLWW
jgi:predicted acylesterase/phospholipase RssA